MFGIISLPNAWHRDIEQANLVDIFPGDWRPSKADIWIVYGGYFNYPCYAYNINDDPEEHNRPTKLVNIRYHLGETE